ncbi:MAG: glycosyltransferase family 2 protein [Conexivisphaerales archaeon]
MTDLSVVVSSYSEQRLEFIEDLLRALANQVFKDFETVVIVDGPRSLYEHVSSIVHEVNPPSPSMICTGGTLGASATRNLGWLNARGRLVAFLDDDVIPTKDWTLQIQKFFMDHPNADVVTGAAYPKWKDSSISWLPLPLHWIVSCTDWLGDAPMPTDRLWSMNCVIKKDALQEVNGFDERLGPHNGAAGYQGIAEDLELGLRLKTKSRSLWFAPDIKCAHYVMPEQVTLTYIAVRSLWIGRTRKLARKLGVTMNAELGLLRLFISPSLVKDITRSGAKSIILALTSLVISLISFSVGLLHSL